MRRYGLLAWLVLVLVIGAGSPAAAAAAWEPQKTYAVLVGILEWQDKDLSSFPKENRQDRVLAARLRARGVPAGNVVFLEDKQATLTAMRRALAETARRAEPGSTLLFYFAGHGLKGPGGTYLANYDVDSNRLSRTGFAVQEIADTLNEGWKGSRVLLMADCCHSGGLADVVRAVGKGNVEAACLTSARASNESTGNWTFTEALVSIFGGQGLVDGNGDGRIVFAEADAYVRREMKYREDQLAFALRSPRFPAAFQFASTAPRPASQPKARWQPGDYGEARDFEGQWYRAQVLAVQGGRYRVHYLGWDAKWDEWITAERLRPVPAGTWRVGDRIQAEWEGQWYPGRITQAEDGFFYFIRYDGHGPEWDEWVTAKRLRK